MNDLADVIGAALSGRSGTVAAPMPMPRNLRETPEERAAAMAGRARVLNQDLVQAQADAGNQTASPDERAAAQQNIEIVTKEIANMGPQAAPRPATPGPFSDLASVVGEALRETKPVAETPPPAPSKAASEPSLFTRMGRGAASLADVALGAPGAVVKGIEYAGARAAGRSPEDATQTASTGLGEFLSNPLGKAAGVTETPEYKGEAGRRLMDWIGENISKGANWIAEKTGLPKADVENMIQSSTLALPKVISGTPGTVRSAVSGVSEAATKAGEIAAKIPGAEAIGIGPSKAAKANIEARASYNGLQERPMTGGGSATARANPYPVLTGEETSRGGFPQVKLAKSGVAVPSAEQAVRSRIANEILGDNAGVRTGVMTGSENALRNEHTAASAPNPTGPELILKQKIANEQTALANYADARVKATGASERLINDAQRGEVINSAVYGSENSLLSYLKDAKRNIYDQARKVVGDNPIKSAHIDELLGNPQFKAGVKLNKNEGVLSGAQELIDLAKSSGFKDPVTGELLPPNSVAAWDAVRKSLNQGWSKDNAHVIRQINSAIDQDIASAGGPALYKMGDAIHKAEKTLLGSKGINSVLGELDANGIATGKPYDAIPKTLNNMPLDQWRHIYDTLDELSRGRVRGTPEGMPPVSAETMQAATAAKAEMQGSLARAVARAGGDKAGVWNQNSVNKTLNSTVGDKIVETFAPDEVTKFHTLNYGGQIMPGVHSYEGAGLQAQRLAGEGFVEKNAPAMGAALGAKGGTIGAVIGSKVGGFAAKISKTRREAAQANRLTDIMNMNAERGRQ